MKFNVKILNRPYNENSALIGNTYVYIFWGNTQPLYVETKNKRSSSNKRTLFSRLSKGKWRSYLMHNLLIRFFHEHITTT